MRVVHRDLIAAAVSSVDLPKVNGHLVVAVDHLGPFELDRLPEALSHWRQNARTPSCPRYTGVSIPARSILDTSHWRQNARTPCIPRYTGRVSIPARSILDTSHSIPARAPRRLARCRRARTRHTSAAPLHVLLRHRLLRQPHGFEGFGLDLGRRRRSSRVRCSATKDAPRRAAAARDWHFPRPRCAPAPPPFSSASIRIRSYLEAATHSPQVSSVMASQRRDPGRPKCLPSPGVDRGRAKLERGIDEVRERGVDGSVGKRCVDRLHPPPTFSCDIARPVVPRPSFSRSPLLQGPRPGSVYVWKLVTRPSRNRATQPARASIAASVPRGKPRQAHAVNAGMTQQDLITAHPV